MKHYFSKVNNVVLTHSDMESTAMGRKVRVYFERPNNGEFDFAEGELPAAEFSYSHKQRKADICCVRIHKNE
jgi:hypothetical protein